MPRVSPLYYAMTTPTRPLGLASRGASRALSAAAPMAMPVIDEYLQSPQVQQALAGFLGQGAEKLGLGSDAQELAAGAAPMLGKLAPRLGAVFGAEALAGGGDLLGAPQEMWDPAVRRESAMMMMPLEQGPGGGGPLNQDYGAPQQVSHQNSGGGPLAGVLGGATGAPIGQVAGAVEGLAMAPGTGLANASNSIFNSGAARRLLDVQGQKSGGGGDAVETFGKLRSVFGADPVTQSPSFQPAFPPQMGYGNGTPDPMQGGRPAGSPPLQANAMARELARKVSAGIGRQEDRPADLASILRDTREAAPQPERGGYRPPAPARSAGAPEPEMAAMDPAIRTHMRRMAAPDPRNQRQMEEWRLRNRGPGMGRMPAYMTNGWGD